MNLGSQLLGVALGWNDGRRQRAALTSLHLVSARRQWCAHEWAWAGVRGVDTTSRAGSAALLHGTSHSARLDSVSTRLGPTLTVPDCGAAASAPPSPRGSSHSAQLPPSHFPACPALLPSGHSTLAASAPVHGTLAG